MSQTIKKKDLGSGSIPKLLFALAFPAVISQIVNMLYNIIDRMYIGHIPEVGVQALTGLGLCFPIIILVTAFSSLFGMGGAPKAAIEMGKKNNDKAEQILGNCVSALIITAICLTSILLLWGEDLLLLFGASENTIPYALDYLNIYAIGTIFVQISLGLNMFITTQGFSKYSMCTVLIGAILNIILDPIFIFVFDMGVQGAALATIISQGVSALWVLKFLTSKKSVLKIKKKNLKIDPKILLPIMALGISPFVMQSTESVLSICFNTSLLKYGGDLAVGAMTILTSIMQLCMMPLIGITQGAQPIISYNYGANKIDRVRQAIYLQIGTCFVFTLCFFVLVQTNPQMLISIFSQNPELTQITTWAIHIYTAGFFALGIQIGCQQVFVALGKSKISLFLACLRKIIILIPLIFILPMIFEDHLFAVFVSEPVADIAATISTFIFFIFINRELTLLDIHNKTTK